MVGFIALVRCSGARGESRWPHSQEGDGVRFAGTARKRFDYLTITPTITICSRRISPQGRCTSSICAPNKIVATVLDTPGAEGVEYVPE